MFHEKEMGEALFYLISLFDEVDASAFERQSDDELIPMLRPGKTSRFLLSFMFAIPHWQRRSLSWDNFRRTGLLERSLPTLW